MPKRPYHHGDLRAALLERAEHTLRQSGAGTLSLRELARDLGVSPGAPSRHFPSKQALLDALALDGFERLIEAIEAALAGAGQAFGERLNALARTYVGFAVANAALLDLMFSAKHSPESSDALEAAVQRWIGQSLELVSTGQRRGEVREGPLDRIALTVFAPLQGYVTMAVTGVPLPETEDRGLDDVIESIIRGCRPE